MKRAIIILSLLAAVCGESKAQTFSYMSGGDSLGVSLFDVIYTHTIRTQDSDGMDVIDSINYQLQVGEKVTRFFSIRREDNPDAVVIYQNAKLFMHPQTVWTNYPEGKQTVWEQIGQQCYVATEDIPVQKWTITDETRNISAYLCHKAVCTFRGIEWTAWYADDIPTLAGPWKLRGLPGLIIDAVSNDGIHHFALSELLQEKEAIWYLGPNGIRNATKITAKELIKSRNKIYGNKRYPKDPSYFIPLDPSSSRRVVSVSVKNSSTIPRAHFSHVFKTLEK